MALFTDGSPASIDDLRRYDNATDDVARDANIDLDSKLAEAAEEVGQEIFRFLLFRSTPQALIGSVLVNGAPGEAIRQRLGLSDVVVSTAIRRWHALRSLAGMYRDAYGSDVSDRYLKKWQALETRAREAEEYAFGTGIGLTRNPVPKCPAPMFTQTSDENQRNDYSVRIAWVSGDGTAGTPSDAVQIALGTGDQVTVPAAAPAGVAGWNIYIGELESSPSLENDTPIGIGAAWTMPGGPLTRGRPLVEGQLPDYLVVERRILPRG